MQAGRPSAVNRHILFDSHQIIDGILEAEQSSNAIGTTKRGIGRRMLDLQSVCRRAYVEVHVALYYY